MCVRMYVLCMAERMNMTLGKFERIMEYANIVLCIRKICRVQMKDLILRVVRGYTSSRRGNFIGRFT